MDLLRAAQSIQAAALLLRIDWSTAQTIMKRAVERGLDRRSLDEVRHVGIDEKSFGAGQDYAGVMTGGLKQLFRFFWQETEAVGGRAFFEAWYTWAIRSGLGPIKKVAGVLKTRLVRILTLFVWYTSNWPLKASTAQFNRSNPRREASVSLNTTEF
jgi:hypothetical protein